MLEPLDILFIKTDGTYLWKAAVESLDAAKSKIEQLATTVPGDYVIFNQNTGNKIVVKRDGLCEPSAAS